MKKILPLLMLAVLGGLFVMSGCRKDNTNDKVDGIDVTIPRILLQNGKITMFVSVTDLDGNAIKDLSSANLIIETIKDGKTTKVSGFNLFSSTSTPTPIAASLAMDYSGSMYYDTAFVPAMEAAVKSFIGLKGLTDKLEIIKFDHNVYVVQPFTTDTILLYAAVDSVMSLSGNTAFYQACLTGLLDAAATVSSTTGVLPAVLGFTDGVNNQAPLNPDTVINMALQLQIPVYTLGFGGTPTYMPDTVTLKHIADTTGGRYYWTPDPNDIQQLYQYVNGQLTGAMVVGFPWGSKANATIRVTVVYQGFVAKAEKKIFY
jgi:Ca-activated chloride channel homolog